MSEYKIEKKIPIPENRSVRKSKYPLSEMKIGDSFFIPINDEKEVLDNLER